MKDLVKKVAVGLATSALVAQSLVLPSFGSITIMVTGNGSDSNNSVDVDQSNTTLVEQSNVAQISNDIDAKANTGDNEVSDNTGGDVDINTGNAETNVEVSNTVNSNEAHVDCGGCPSDVNVEISGNGSDSENEVELELENTTWVDQANFANLKNDIDAKAKTGDNEAEDNTGGDISIDTGNASADVNVSNKANANIASVGSQGQGTLDALIIGNGSGSDNSLDLDLENEVGVSQENWANISNDIEVEANTGENEAEDNTGGAVSIDTGDAEAGAMVDNMANFNFALVEDCCELDGLVKIAGNGTESENEVELEVEAALYVTQENKYLCGEDDHRGGKWEWPWKDDGECDVDVEADTGNNEVEDNTGAPEDDPSVDTGDATTEVEVSHEANSNVFMTGDAELPDFELDLGDLEDSGLLVWFWSLWS